MDVQSNTVSKAVTEIVAIPGLSNRLTGDTVDFPAVRAGSDGSNCRLLSLQYDLIDFLQFRGRFPGDDAAVQHCSAGGA